MKVSIDVTNVPPSGFAAALLIKNYKKSTGISEELFRNIFSYFLD